MEDGRTTKVIRNGTNNNAEAAAQAATKEIKAKE
jgi:hypothetical protein